PDVAIEMNIDNGESLQRSLQKAFEEVDDRIALLDCSRIVRMQRQTSLRAGARFSAAAMRLAPRSPLVKGQLNNWIGPCTRPSVYSWGVGGGGGPEKNPPR